MPKTAANIRAAKPSPINKAPLKKDPAPPASAAHRAPKRIPSESDLVIAGLSASDGVTITDLCEAAGWQAHSCRAFFTGLRKNGRRVERSKRSDGTTIYRLAAGEVAAQ